MHSSFPHTKRASFSLVLELTLVGKRFLTLGAIDTIVTFSLELETMLYYYVAGDLEFLLNHKNSMYRVEPRFSNAA